ncbi:MAG: hypothetical protein ABIW19_17475 [Vicinamibacterales bacterium]
MDLTLSIDIDDTLVVHLREADAHTTVAVRPSRAGAASLRRAVDAAVSEGYGDCFWPGATGGQYWWIFNRRAETLEVVAMWTRGGASLWEHVFRATDASTWVQDRLRSEADRMGLLAD